MIRRYNTKLAGKNAIEIDSVDSSDESKDSKEDNNKIEIKVNEEMQKINEKLG